MQGDKHLLTFSIIYNVPLFVRRFCERNRGVYQKPYNRKFTNTQRRWVVLLKLRYSHRLCDAIFYAYYFIYAFINFSLELNIIEFLMSSPKQVSFTFFCLEISNILKSVKANGCRKDKNYQLNSFNTTIFGLMWVAIAINLEYFC